MNRLCLLPVLASGWVATSAFAGENCTFTQECFEAEACTETYFTMAIEGDTLVTDAETISVNTGGSDTVGVFVGYTSSAFHVLTREKNGPARYATHIFDGVMMVNYLGTCEVP